jgi:hypothetical protein
MLTQLTTLKSRLSLLDATYDAVLERTIIAISARFDRETNRTLARMENATFEFPGHATEIAVPCYPIESVTKFESKTSEAAGWVEQPGLEYVIRRHCIIQLPSPLAHLQSAALDRQRAVCRVIYTGGYRLPGSPEFAGATDLPADLEHAAIEQTAFWFQTKDKLGVIRQWPKGGSYEQFADPDLLPAVRETLSRYTRWVL